MFIPVNLKPEQKVEQFASTLYLISVKVSKTMEESMVKMKVPAKP